MSAKYQQFDRFDKKESQTADLSTFVFGKVQPQSVDVEESILGSILSKPEAYSIVSDILRETSFYTEVNQLI